MAELEQLKGKNWMAAMTLCWLFGVIGAHRFYTGKQSSAWAMCAMSILGLAPITCIWAIIDGVMLALGNFTHEDGSELYEKINWFGWTYVVCMILSIGMAFIYFALFVAMAAGALAGAAS